MAARIRRPKREQPAPSPTLDQQTRRAVRQVVADTKSRVLPSDADLDDASIVMENDIRRGESLWDEAQRRAGTGLEGMLSATQDGDRG